MGSRTLWEYKGFIVFCFVYRVLLFSVYLRSTVSSLSYCKYCRRCKIIFKYFEDEVPYVKKVENHCLILNSIA